MAAKLVLSARRINPLLTTNNDRSHVERRQGAGVSGGPHLQESQLILTVRLPTLTVMETGKA